MTLQANGQQKEGVAMLISDKTDFKIKKTMRDKEGQYIMIKGTFHQEDITLVNIYAPNIGATRYIWLLLTALKGEVNSNTIIVVDLNIPLTSMDRSSRQKVNKEILALNGTLDETHLRDIQNIPSKSRIHILLKCTWNILKGRP